ncbi:MAG TPA: hypothetical protein DIV40_05885 [Clostridiales bacterium]|nr:hypothetical protein [Clostridiales bacterium]
MNNINNSQRNLIDENELKKELSAKNIPTFYAKEIIKCYGKKNGLIDETYAFEKIVPNIKKSLKFVDRITPKTIFEDVSLTPDELISYIDWRLHYIKEKYKPHGLNLPFQSLEDAHSWLVKESFKDGVLKIPRITCPTLINYEFYSYIYMPYRKRVDNKGVTVKDNIICNHSPFLLELNNIINSLKDSTGIDKIEILNYFLCNEKIEFKRVIGTIAADAFNQYIIFQINANDLTKAEWNEMYNVYRLNTSRKHKKRLSDEHIKLDRILEKMEVPDNPTANLCRNIINEWNKETGDNMDIENWRTMKRRIERLRIRKKEMSLLNHSFILDNLKNFKEEV